ncbi:MAG: prepilin-type N-terminal cleavage/methylation domain-containing protein [Clostridiales bacterium]|nr:prepilin-type N-terminal cleavage/methylation domain-containing protein [Clostridiales bacterium]
MRKNNGFTLIEMMVAIVIFTIITVPMLTLFYFGARALEKQTGTTQELSMVRETIGILVDDLEKYSSNATRVDTKNNDENEVLETKLVIRDDDNFPEGEPKKIIYTYNNKDRVLIRDIDGAKTLLLTNRQLTDDLYKEPQKVKYDIERSPPVQLTKDTVRNTIRVYIRVKTDIEANPQEGEYVHRIGEQGRKVIKFKKDGYIRVNENEKFNFYRSSFTIESYFKMDDIVTQRSLFNLIGDDNKSRVNVLVKDKKLEVRMNDSIISTVEYDLEKNNIDYTTGVWRRFVLIYDDEEKMLHLYVTKENEPTQLNEGVHEAFDTEKMLYNGVEESLREILIDKIYIGNENDSSNDSYDGILCLYEPKIWLKIINPERYDVSRKLVSDEEKLAVYIKDDYGKHFQDGVLEFKVVNAVNNKKMKTRNIEIYEDVVTQKNDSIKKTTIDDISEVLG